MAYAEFPSTIYSTETVGELIHYYKEVKESYNGTLTEILNLKERLNMWEQNGTALLTEMTNNVKAEIIRSLNESTQTMQSNYAESLNTIKHNYEASLERLRNEISQAVLDLSEQMQEELNTISSMYQHLETKFDGRMEQLEQQSENNSAQITTEINNVKEQLQTELNEKIQQINNNIDVKVEEAINNRELSIDIEINNLTDMIEQLEISVMNKIDTINQWIENYDVKDNILEIYYNNGLSCKDWYDMPYITCTYWNCKKITCIEWLSISKQVFGYYNKKLINPITGIPSTVEQILITLINKLQVNTITVEEYDKMKLTAEEYDKLHLTASQYDWRGIKNVFRKDC